MSFMNSSPPTERLSRLCIRMNFLHFYCWWILCHKQKHKTMGKQTINKDGICATASTHHPFFTLPASRRWAGVLFVTVHHASVPLPRSPFCHAEVGVGLRLTAVTVSGLMRLEVIAPTAWCHLWCCSTVQETLLQDQLLCSFVLQAGSEAPMTFFTFFSFLPFLKFV